MPDEELASVERIFFQIEQAHWFYEDFIRELNPSLPSFSLKKFSAKFFQHCPLLHEWSNEHETAFANFMDYKIRVPVCGAIILNDAMDKVWEETGFDMSSRLVEEDYVELTKNDQRIRLYIIKAVPEDTVFETQTRKEISKIEWHRLVDLPATKPKPVDRGQYSGKESGSDRASTANAMRNFNRYYMVTPFVQKLKSWISMQRKIAKRKRSTVPLVPVVDHTTLPTISSPTAQKDSDMLKTMLGIGPGTVAPSPSTPHPHTHETGTPITTTGSQPSSASLKAMLGIKSEGNGTSTTTPTLSASTRPFSPFKSLPVNNSESSTSDDNGSNTLKALLGIPSSADGIPLHQHARAHSSPTVTNLHSNGMVGPEAVTPRWQDNHSSPPLQNYYSPPGAFNRHSFPSYGVTGRGGRGGGGGGGNRGGRKSSVDLLALLNSGSASTNNNHNNTNNSSKVTSEKAIPGSESPMAAQLIQSGHQQQHRYYVSNNGNNRPLSFGGQGAPGVLHTHLHINGISGTNTDTISSAGGIGKNNGPPQPQRQQQQQRGRKTPATMQNFTFDLEALV
ncbi:mRNA-decapping enzyme subunit 2 [Podila humilis]|nr:mRNA-decapping enzyme subunit 2 [Podila humilis]